MPRTGLTSEQLHDRAIEAAGAAIRRGGFERVRLVDIARDLGVSHVVLYKHFADKNALLDAVSARWLAGVDQALAEAAAAPRRTAVRRLHDLFSMLHRLKRDRVRADPQLYRAFSAASDAGKPFIRQHLVTLHDLVLGLVKEAQRNGELRSGSAAGITALLINATAAFTHPSLVAETVHEDRELALQQVLDAVFRGLK